MAALRRRHGTGEVIVPTLTWVSDIAAVLQNDLMPVFVDIDPRTLGMDTRQVLSKLSAKTRAVFITHILGYNALTRELVDELAARQQPNGSWTNPKSRWLEGDPNLVTAYVLLALSYCRPK